MIVSTIRLKLRRSSYRRLAFVCIIASLLASSGTIGLSQEGDKPQASYPETGSDEEITFSSPIANQPLALRRYRMLKQIERRFGDFPLYGPTDARHSAFFPRGRGDKVYIYAPWGFDWINIRGYKDEQLLCFESKGNDIKLLYWVKLKRVNFKPPKYENAVRSMLDYISTLGYGSHRDRSLNGDEPRTYSYAVSGYIKENVKRDLSLKQELVMYEFHSFNNILTVKCFNSKVAFDDLREQLFQIAGDTGSESAAKWYRTYGLPIADCELSAESKHTGKQK